MERKISRLKLASILLNSRGHKIEIREFTDTAGYFRSYVLGIDGKNYTTGNQTRAKKHLEDILEVEFSECKTEEETSK